MQSTRVPFKSLSALFLASAVLVVAAIAAPADAAPELKIRAKIFDKESGKKTILYNYTHELDRQGSTETMINTFTGLDGKVAVVETTEQKVEGGKETFVRYHSSQKQIGAEGSLELKNGEAHFSYTRDGKTKTSKEKVGDDFVVGPTVLSALRKNWTGLMNGNKIRVRFGVVDRLETVGFEFFKDKEAEIDGQKAVVIKMKPSSFLIAALVNPLHFYMTPDGSRLMELHGRTQPKREENGKFKDLDAVTVYEDVK